MRQLLVLACSVIIPGAAFCTEIHVPADQPSIQAAINAAQDGDTVIVSPGRYLEHIDFLGGDADGDGRVSVLDFIRIRNSLGLAPSSSPDARLADVNGDGSVNMVDLLLVRRQFQGR